MIIDKYTYEKRKKNLEGVIKRYICISLLLLFVITILIGCQTVLHEIEDFTLSELDTNVHEWVQSYKGEEGVYLARIPISRRVEEYYVYINRPDTYSVQVGNDNVDNNTLKIEINLPGSLIPVPTVTEPNPFTGKISKITTINKRARKLCLMEK